MQDILKRLPLVLILSGTALSLVNCRAMYTYPPTISTKFSEASTQSLEVKVVWLKNKQDAVDVMVQMINHYPHPVVFTQGAIQLSINDRRGYSSGAGFTYALQPNEMWQKVLVFRFDPALPPNVGGAATLAIAPISKGAPVDNSGGQMTSVTVVGTGLGGTVSSNAVVGANLIQAKEALPGVTFTLPMDRQYLQ